MQDQVTTFGGFTQPTNEDYFATLHYWKMIGASINNLAEYKVIDYILQVTWGTYNPYNRVPLTIEALMHGYIDDEGVQIDNGTGLSRQSVITGLEKAINHGLIERHIEYWMDEDGNTRSTRYYGLHFYEAAEVNDLDSQESTVEIADQVPDEIMEVNDLDFDGNRPVEPVYDESLNSRLSSNSLELHTHNNISRDVIRIQEDQIVDSGQPSEPRSSHRTKPGKHPAFICAWIERLSQDLGDHEHTASNVGQASRIYALFLASGGTAEAFCELLQSCKEASHSATIKKKNSQGRPNRMPYFFACLRRACAGKEQTAA
jgi:hypothetical protein